MVPTYTPRATPVVPAPEQKPGKAARDVRPRPELVAPVTVITPQGDRELTLGSLLIGRLPECDVNLEDSLVSRMHARISVHGSNVVVEDLHSTNGVYVNGRRVGHSTVLREGDRILIGTCELSLFESRESSSRRSARPVSSSSPHHAAPSPQRKPSSREEPRVPLNVPHRSEQMPSTARADALKMIGGLADRLAAAGNLTEAAQVLSGHLKRILKGANSGLSVPADVAAAASHHALTLARWTKQASWADYVVELHLSGRLVMNAVTLASYEEVVTTLDDFDRMLLGYYVEGLQERLEKLDLDERKRVDRLHLLVRLAGG